MVDTNATSEALFETLWCGYGRHHVPVGGFNVDLSRKSRGGRAARCRECERDAQYVKRYGLNVAEYDELLAVQGKACAICWTPADDGEHKLVIDHNHLMQGRSAIRGLLCSPCNMALGMFLDRPGVMRRAADYVERNGVDLD